MNLIKTLMFNRFVSQYLKNNYFNYSTNIKDRHDVDATLGMAFQKYSSQSAWVEGQDFPVDDFRLDTAFGCWIEPINKEITIENDERIRPYRYLLLQIYY